MHPYSVTRAANQCPGFAIAPSGPWGQTRITKRPRFSAERYHTVVEHQVTAAHFHHARL